MLMAIAFVPKHDVCASFNELVRCKYFEENEVVLKPLLWNCHDVVLQDLMRTNNSLEGWHNSFNGKVRVNHASLSKYISILKCEQSITECLLVQMNTRMTVAAKKKRIYVDIELRLKNIVTDYDLAKKLQFLHDIAAVLSL
ncbi:uncharacterized protein LOC122526415 [Polistes fuscatus]|uniref:uncharacterized protein LOC122526415 n=1 Tax=Polistes fuscatus TaxID=30207 RepID=UPI001CA8CFAB|nr:uncharacterized protein LOC122526415 [Polistes fuscatus]